MTEYEAAVGYTADAGLTLTRGYALRRLVAARRRSLLRAGYSMLDQVAEGVLDRRHRIRAGGLVTTESLGIAADGNHDYAGTGYRPFRRMLSCLPPAAFDGTFVDYGCGLGRVLVMAARYPFRRVVGVELSDRLLVAARENLDRAGLAADGRIALWGGDAAGFPLPPDATVLYLFNPFHGEPLEAVVERLRASLAERPRQVFVVVNNPVHFAAVAAGKPWLTLARRFRFEYDAHVYVAAPPASGPAG